MCGVVLKVRGSFHAAHRLEGYNGECSNLHGHSYRYVVYFSGIVREDGMVEDFKKLSEIVNEVIKDLDHRFLNDILGNSTCENIATHMLLRLKELLRGGNVEVLKVELWETDKYGVEVSAQDLS